MRKYIALTTVLVCASISFESVFAAEDGYYSHPAIYGNRVIFSCEGDLWTATIPDDEDETIIAHRLTSDDGNESWPCISPDGKWIAFTAQYEGNTDVYIMPIDGGAPKRLTFHPGSDISLGFTASSSSVLFRSGREHPFDRTELWNVSIDGRMPYKYDFGECSQGTINPGGKLIAITQWSNENWTWKGYRGGTAPDIWIGEFASKKYAKLTDNDANDLFPMWARGRVYFLSDRDGQPNIHSDSPRGNDLAQHTAYKFDASDPAAEEGYDIRWPSVDPALHGAQIIFAQGGKLVVLNVDDDSIERLNIQIASDHVARRKRFIQPQKTTTEFSLSDDGSTLLVGTRGEIISFPVKNGMPLQLTRMPSSREWGASFVNENEIVLITDIDGEQEITRTPSDGSGGFNPLTTDREDWLFPPRVSPDGTKLAFADKTMRLHVMDLFTMRRDIIDRSVAGEITDYRFSPDSQWLAYTKPMPNGMGRIFLYSVRTGRAFALTDGLHNEHHPRWDPKGHYLYFLAESSLNPMIGSLDFEHIYSNTTQIYAVSLRKDTPVPVPAIADNTDFDLEKWADRSDKDTFNTADITEEEGADEEGEEKNKIEPIRLDTIELSRRIWLLSIDAGNYVNLEAVYGGVCFQSEPVKGLLDETWPPPPPGVGDGTLYKYDFVSEKTTTLAEKIDTFVINEKCDTVAYPVANGIAVKTIAGEAEPEIVKVGSFPLRIEVQEEWKQIFYEAWRLQRDFYFASNMGELNWDAILQKYETILPRIGTRDELNDLIGEMIGELRTSHTYIWGGEQHDQSKQVSVGLLGVDIGYSKGVLRILRVIPRQTWSDSLASPLSMPHLKVKDGTALVAINGIQLTRRINVYDILQGLAGKQITITLADDNGKQRDIQITTISDEKAIRYAAWVEDNRKFVADATDGKVGYLHIPNMGGDGLVAFSRYFYPQLDKHALIVDVRNNGGGFVSQMIIQRLARKVWAFQQPRHGTAEKYPSRTLHGHLAVLINQHAGSDGDVFPESFRIRELGPLIGTRTWGGVVGIRADKPFVDLGISTQPEFAWWEPKRGWSLENRGVSPDIEVPITPTDRRNGNDPQLEKAIEVLLKKLEENPMELPKMPALPDKTKGNN